MKLQNLLLGAALVTLSASATAVTCKDIARDIAYTSITQPVSPSARAILQEQCETGRKVKASGVAFSTVYNVVIKKADIISSLESMQRDDPVTYKYNTDNALRAFILGYSL